MEIVGGGGALAARRSFAVTAVHSDLHVGVQAGEELG